MLSSIAGDKAEPLLKRVLKEDGNHPSTLFLMRRNMGGLPVGVGPSVGTLTYTQAWACLTDLPRPAHTPRPTTNKRLQSPQGVPGSNISCRTQHYPTFTSPQLFSRLLTDSLQRSITRSERWAISTVTILTHLLQLSILSFARPSRCA